MRSVKSGGRKLKNGDGGLLHGQKRYFPLVSEVTVKTWIKWITNADFLGSFSPLETLE